MEPADTTIDIIEKLNNDHFYAQKLSQEELKRVLEYTEVQYYNETEDSEYILTDLVYDHVKEVYIALCNENKYAHEEHIYSHEEHKYSHDDMAHVPEPIGRMSKLPIWMGSTTKMNHGTGQLRIFTSKFDGPWTVSAKLDGASALYVNENGKYKLYSRGKGDRGQNISEFLKYLQLPSLKTGQMVRGELIIKKSLFTAKYKRGDSGDMEKHRNSRNAVAGMVNKVGSNASKGVETPFTEMQLAFISDIDFIVYELITDKLQKCSVQFTQMVELFTSKVAAHESLKEVDDDTLSLIYDEYAEELDYEIDGLVVCSDHEYDRPHGKNPEYIRAYKKPLTGLTGIATVQSIEWNVSKDGMIKPVVIFDKIEMDGSSITRASGYNAKNIIDNKIGPGAVIEVIRSGGIIPKITKVIEQCEVLQMPKLAYVWSDTKVDIFVDYANGDEFSEEKRDMNVKKLYYFLTKMGTKGIGEKTMGRMYDEGIRTIPQLITVNLIDLNFLGDKTAQNIVKTIQDSRKNLTLPVLCGASMIFGRLLGVKRFEIIFEQYPNIMEMDIVLTNDVKAITTLILKIDGFADKTAKQVAEGFEDMIRFLEELREANILPAPMIQEAAVSKQVLSQNEKAASHQDLPTQAVAPKSNASKEISGLNILITGFRDEVMKAFILQSGGKIPSSFTKATNMLIIKDDSVSNTKTKTAEDRGLIIMTKDQFIAKYMS